MFVIHRPVRTLVIPDLIGDLNWHYLQTIISAAMLVALQCLYHFVYKVIDVEKFHLYRTVIDLDRKVVGYVVAECGDCGVVVRPAPFSEKVRETVYEYLCSCLLSVIEHQFLSGFLALSVFACAEAACKSRLNGAGDHHRAVVAILLESIKKDRCKTEVALHEVFLILRTVHSRKVEDEVAITAIAV